MLDMKETAALFAIDVQTVVEMAKLGLKLVKAGKNEEWNENDEGADRMIRESCSRLVKMALVGLKGVESGKLQEIEALIQQADQALKAARGSDRVQ